MGEETDYLELLNHSFKMEKEEDEDILKPEYLSDCIFEFTTYDSDMSELFARKAVDVCRAINQRTTFEYIGESEDNYQWYLIMCNMPFFNNRIDWGGSIRGAWRDHDKYTIKSTGLWQGEEQLLKLEMDREQWIKFIDAIIEFAKEP